MSEKRLLLVRKTEILRIFSEGEHLFSPINITIFGVTGLKRIGIGWYDIYSNGALIGFISGVVEVKELW